MTESLSKHKAPWELSVNPEGFKHFMHFKHDASRVLKPSIRKQKNIVHKRKQN